MYASNELKQKAIEKSGVSNLFETSFWYNFAYTDYGGTFFDKVCIAYFRENCPDNFVSEKTGWRGENGILFNTPDDTNLVEDFREATANYLLGYGNLEEFYYEMQWEQTEKDFECFLEDLKRDYFVKSGTLNYLLDNYSGYFSMQANSLDFCYSKLEKDLKKENWIFPLHGNELFESLSLMFPSDLEEEMAKENNIICPYQHLKQNDMDIEEMEFDIQDIEKFFGCFFSVNQYNDFCVNWNEG